MLEHEKLTPQELGGSVLSPLGEYQVVSKRSLVDTVDDYVSFRRRHTYSDSVESDKETADYLDRIVTSSLSASVLAELSLDCRASCQDFEVVLFADEDDTRIGALYSEYVIRLEDHRKELDNFNVFVDNELIFVPFLLLVHFSLGHFLVFRSGVSGFSHRLSFNRKR
jgi:hypothetical protein